MSAFKGTPGPWLIEESAVTPGHYRVLDSRFRRGKGYIAYPASLPSKRQTKANARLIAAAPELLEALHEGRRAIGDHYAPNDCYATGPVTGDAFRDLVECPACAFIAKYDAAIAKATGGAA